MRDFAIALTIVFVVGNGCASGSEGVRPTVPVGMTHRIETAPLPPTPEEEPLPSNTPRADFVEPVEVGMTATRSGILVSEARAFRDAQYRIRYRELRLNYEADRQVWVVQRELYETRLTQAEEALRAQQPTWIDRHALELGFFGGFVLGTVGVLAAAALTR